MPQPPQVGLITRYVLENPYPLALVLLALAGGLAWTAVRNERRDRLRAGGALAILGVAVLLLGAVVVTSGEHARRITRALVEAAVAADVSAAMQLFADEATLSFGRATNPGYATDEIHWRLERLDDQWRIESNRITMLRSYSESSDAATVHLACLTMLTRGYGATPTQWVLRIQRQPGGGWKIAHVTWVSINRHPPSRDLDR